MTYDILATGSGGNAVIINGEILIDCGVPMKKLRDSGYIKSLKLILLTHEHGDHFNPATVRALHRERPALRWVCCEWMGMPLLMAGVDNRLIMLQNPVETWNYMDVATVTASRLQHDAANCGWHIYTNSGACFYATDTGTLDGIEAKNYDLYLIEANHTREEIEARIEAKLAAGQFAYEYRAAQNHLSYEQAMDWLAQNAGPNSRYELLHQHRDKEAG